VQGEDESNQCNISQIGLALHDGAGAGKQLMNATKSSNVIAW
jgi:hypothetical protein